VGNLCNSFFLHFCIYLPPLNISGTPEASALKFSAKTCITQLHLLFEPQVDWPLNAPVGEKALKMEQISHITTIFRRVQNVVKYQPSSLKLLHIVAGASPDCAKNLWGWGIPEIGFTFAFAAKISRAISPELTELVDVKFAESAEGLNACSCEF